MSNRRPLTLLASALLVLSAGCALTVEPEPVDPVAEESCSEEGYDPGTTEYVNCIEELD